MAMTDEQMRLYEAYFSENAQPNWRGQRMVYLSPMDAVEALWPLNDVFREHHDQISSLAYEPAFEAEADAALLAFTCGERWSAKSPSAAAWRVLMERHLQSIAMCMANHFQGRKTLVPVPPTLPKSKNMGAVMLFLQYSMRLPYPVQDRKNYSWSATSSPATLTKH